MHFRVGFNRALLCVPAIGLLLAGCAQTPMGPTVQVMPGPGKSFEAFRADQDVCRTYAAQQVSGQAESANQRAVGTALLGTALGVGVGALAGSVSGNAGAGAAIGGAAGVGLGTGIGAGNSANQQYTIQQQYDIAFSQCMYAKGNQVRGYAQYSPTPAYVPAPAQAAVPAGPDPALVRATQNELIRLNYLDDVADGVMGPRTSRAIQAFEQANGLPVDGAVSRGLLSRLQSTPGGAAPAGAAPIGAAPLGTGPAPASDWVTPKSP